MNIILNSTYTVIKCKVIFLPLLYNIIAFFQALSISLHMYYQLSNLVITQQYFDITF